MLLHDILDYRALKRELREKYWAGHSRCVS
jgi:hypothetical protein